MRLKRKEKWVKRFIIFPKKCHICGDQFFFEKMYILKSPLPIMIPSYFKYYFCEKCKKENF